ncbi:hypothetical protein VCUG_02303 [Vavraia culicis subsp. floridensis]|uniref:E2 ubiquitin-conjugating enzyme n=1 Tax=Vavraia culicis (isolate floridensis) TaxID=948595 RepID=L2GS66_VAVCU|nr:uncharacterized protein VCUG_02303 [Vavraia culicis subsp. floridensis]ELA46222.1 hypothetical protein VCUG_02303 [Vavraia culicis subsp. floridensis]
MATVHDSSAKRRIHKELLTLQREANHPDINDKTLRCFEITTNPDDNIFEWHVKLRAPEESMYAGGIFNLKITFPTDYPFKPPSVVFLTRIYHPNINANGNICLDILRESWTPALTVQKVIISLISWLDEPNPKDPLVPEIGRLYITDIEAYKKKVKEYVRLYAKDN